MIQGTGSLLGGHMNVMRQKFMYPVVRSALFCAGSYAGTPLGQSGQLVCVCVCVCVCMCVSTYVCDQWVETGLATPRAGVDC